MEPAWVKLDASDPLYEADKEKWWADAYGHDTCTDAYLLGLTGPDGHSPPAPYWIITRVPNENVIGSRFIATKLPHVSP